MKFFGRVIFVASYISMNFSSSKFAVDVSRYNTETGEHSSEHATATSNACGQGKAQ
jgi:hypothetical protein